MKDPRNVFALDDLRLIVGREIIPAVMAEKDITRLIERYFGASDMAALNKELAANSKGKEREREDTDLSALDDNAVVRVVDNIIREAALQDASDIHIEPTEHNVKVRLRVDGSLREYQELPKAAAQSILARIKIVGNLDIAERRVPQDGRVRFKRGAIDLDLRLSTLPTVYGEKAVMRLLKKASDIPEIEQLGFSEHNYQRFIDTIEKPYGIFLITGPDGIGQVLLDLLYPQAHQHARREHHHRRGSRRVRDSRHQPDPGERRGGPDLRAGAALVPASGPRHHHDRRDS
jgi:type IV pilus assembly protein PilB